MKRSCLVCVLLFFLLGKISAQKIQYARQTIKEPEANYMQLVANISGSHHLLYFNNDKKLVACVFDPKLQSFSKKEINIKPRQSQDINILPFKGHYLVYLHTAGSGHHYLFRIGADGSSSNISSTLGRATDSSWNKSKATYQLFNQGERLVIVSHTYYDAIKKMASTLVKLNESLATESVNKVLTNFDGAKERLEQVVVAGDELLILKTGKTINGGSEMSLSRTSFANGHTTIKTFDAGNHVYTNPVFRFNTDSSILVSALINERIGNSGLHKVVVICNLGDSLQELAPVTLLKNQFRKNAADNFLLFGEKNQSWVHMGGPVSRSRTSVSYNDMRNSGPNNEPSFNIQNNRTRSTDYYYPGYPTAIRFSLMNEKFKKVQDSLVANDGNIFDVMPRPFGKFVMNGKAYLVLVQNFSPKKRGLLILSGSTDGKFVSQDIPVFDRYQYLLSQLQPVGNEYFILPYTYKNETGLVKITMKD